MYSLYPSLTVMKSLNKTPSESRSRNVFLLKSVDCRLLHESHTYNRLEETCQETVVLVELGLSVAIRWTLGSFEDKVVETTDWKFEDEIQSEKLIDYKVKAVPFQAFSLYINSGLLPKCQLKHPRISGPTGYLSRPAISRRPWRPIAFVALVLALVPLQKLSIDFKISQ